MRIPNIMSMLDAMRRPTTKPMSNTTRVPLANIPEPTATRPADATPDTHTPAVTGIPLANDTQKAPSRVPDATRNPSAPSADDEFKEKTSPKARLIADVESHLRKYVVSTMPIRLILVDQTGPISKLRLIERDAVVWRIMESMKKEKAFSDPSNIAHIHEIAQKKATFGILSHRWEMGELNYRDINELRPDSPNYLTILRSPGYVKLQEFSSVLRSRGIEFAWADTVCIDKSSSAELDESIRSMFKWYGNADICIVYLAQTTSVDDLGGDKWFTRGWTLQELLAPRKLKFYDQKWHLLTTAENDKKLSASDEQQRKVRDTVFAVTGISSMYYDGFHGDNISAYMVLMSRRETTREEDMSYAMMGLFGVSMSPAYGEGSQRAFFRLFTEITNITDSTELFNWASHPLDDSVHPSRMIPSSPACFLQHYTLQATDGARYNLFKPPLLTGAGLRMKVLVIPVTLKVTEQSEEHEGSYPVTLEFPIAPDDALHTLELGLHVDGDTISAIESETLDDFALGLINIHSEDWPVPSSCLSVLMYKVESASFHTWTRLPTKEVIAFENYNWDYNMKNLKDAGIATGIETVYL